ncbi:MAG: ankyrin repeat domain-containing protein [Acidobacteria bacterium]|nr:ankyrin repeat domain-containing protein [Acidobacteriota bacterium]
MTPRQILQAAARGDIAALTLALNADPGALNRNSPHPYWGGEAAPIHLAAEWGQTDTVKFLLGFGATPNPDSSIYDHWTPLQIAIHRDRAPVIELLLAAGAERTVWAAAALGDLAAVEQRLALIHEPSGPNGATALHFANTVPVAELLLANGARLDAKDKYGRTPAEMVSSYGARYREAALFLTGKAGEMDYVRAVTIGEIDIVRDLYDPAKQVIHLAALHGHAAIVEFLLEKGAGPDAGYALHMAARNGHIDAARVLIAHGADLDLKDGMHQSTPLGWAEFHGQTHMVAFLRNPVH